MRIEALRFALLIVLTIALASVALRINSHSSSTSPPARTGPMTAPQGSSPSSGASGPQTSPGQQQPGTAAAGGGSDVGNAGGGSGASDSGAGSGTVQQLPVTGWDSTMKLGALAFVLIGGGMFSIRSAGPSRRRQRASVQD